MTTTTQSTTDMGSQENLLSYFHLPEAIALRDRVRAWVRDNATNQGMAWEELGTTP